MKIYVPKDESINKKLGKEQLKYTDIFPNINQIFQNSRIGVKEEGVRNFIIKALLNTYTRI
jgi:hypothetical protein